MLLVVHQPELMKIVSALFLKTLKLTVSFLEFTFRYSVGVRFFSMWTIDVFRTVYEMV